MKPDGEALQVAVIQSQGSYGGLVYGRTDAKRLNYCVRVVEC